MKMMNSEKVIGGLSSTKEKLKGITDEMLNDIENNPSIDETAIALLKYYHHQLQVVHSDLSSSVSRLEDIVDAANGR